MGGYADPEELLFAAFPEGLKRLPCPIENETGLLGPCGLNWPRVEASGFMSRGDCGAPRLFMDRFWSRLRAETGKTRFKYF